MNYFKHIVKRVLLLVMLVTFGFMNSNAQSDCFENLGEVSGIDMSQYADDLNTAACELIETLPEEYQSQFKVFDYGFYSLTEATDSDIDALWENVIIKAQSKSPFYLLIGKLSGSNGIYTDYFVDIKLPPIIDPNCADNLTRKIAEIKVILNSELNFVQKEIDAMGVLETVGQCEICDDGIDNDGDGHTDCADFDCLYLQIQSQLKGSKGSSGSRDSCIGLSTEQIDIFVLLEEYIVSLEYESSAEVLEEIEALIGAKCLAAAITSVALDYTIHWFTLNLKETEEYPFWDGNTATTIIKANGLSLGGNAVLACGEEYISWKLTRIQEFLLEAGKGFISGFISSAEEEYNKYKETDFSLYDILTKKMNWGGIFQSATAEALTSVILKGVKDQVSPEIVGAYSENKGRTVDKIKRLIGADVWLAIKDKFVEESTEYLEDALTKLRGHFETSGITSSWNKFINDFGNNLLSLEWFKNNTKNKIDAWDVLDAIESDLKIDIPALTKLVDDIEANSTLESFLRNNPSKKEVWELLHKTPYSPDINALNYVDDIKSSTRLGYTTNINPDNGHLTTWRAEFPDLQGGEAGSYFNVHHSIERQVINTRWPNIFTWEEINSLENLRGISGEINAQVHLSAIRIKWDEFYAIFPPGGIIPTKQQILDYAKEVDDEFGKYFSPPIRPVDY